MKSLNQIQEYSAKRSRSLGRPQDDTSVEDITPDYAYVSANEQGHLLDYWKILVKRGKLVVLVLLLALGVGAYFTLSATPLYTTSAIIKIDPQSPSVTGVPDMLPSEAFLAGPYDYYQTQFALLKSRSLAATVIHDLQLESNPSFAQVRVVSASPAARIKSSVFGFMGKLASYFSSKEKKTQTTSEIQTEDRQGQIAPRLEVSPGLVGRYQSFLTVEPLKNTRLVVVKFTTPDPLLSQKLANNHASAFVRRNLETRFELTNEARDFLDNKNSELKQKLEKSEAALNAFRQTHGVVSLEKGENIVVDRFVDLNRQLTTAKSRRIEAESLYRTVQNKDALYLSQVVTQGLIPTLKSNVAVLEAEQAKLSTVFKPDHPRLVELGQQIASARRALNQEIANVVRGIEETYRAARAGEQALQAEADSQQQRALNLQQVGVEYAVLEEEVKVNRSLYESVLKRLSETHVGNDLTVSNIRLAEPAEKPLGPSSPDVARSLLLFGAFGLFLGVASVFLLEYLDASVGTPKHVWQVTALNTFGVVPDLNTVNGQLPLSPQRLAQYPFIKRLLAAPHRGNGSASLNGNGSPSKELIISQHPLSMMAECYRSIRTSLLFSQPDNTPQVILITSPSSGEGKTMTALNLAIALAQDQHKVLLIDADLRRGCCHTRLGLKNHNGLSNILTGKLSLDAAIRPTPVDGLSFISRGVCPPNPSDLLGSQRMSPILDSLRESFKFILIDSPPAIAISDAAILSNLCDGVLLVLHGQKTTAAAACQAIEQLDSVRARLLGVVLNGVDVRKPEYVYYRYYYGSSYASTSHADGDDPESSLARKPADLTLEELARALTGSSAVPQKFFTRIVPNFSEAVGPMAPLILRDQLEIMGESTESFPQNRLKELFEVLSREITDENLRKSFERRLAEELRSLNGFQSSDFVPHEKHD